MRQFNAPLVLAWGMLLYIIVFGTMAEFSIYMHSVKLIGSVKASLFACVEPIAATILTAVWMKVSFAVIDLLGFVMIIATIFILAFDCHGVAKEQ